MLCFNFLLKKADDLAKQYAAGMKKIKPGITGNIKPMMPIKVNKTPQQKKNIFIILLVEGSAFIEKITDIFVKTEEFI